MAIVQMVTREKFEANVGNPNFWITSNYQGAEAGLIRHSPACSRYHHVNYNGIRGYEIGPGYSDCVTYNDPRAKFIVKEQTGVYGTVDGKSGYIAGECDGPFEPLYMERSHEGLVLETREINKYDDSDFYAIVWNPQKGEIERVLYASTRGWTYPNSAQVDATPEVQAAYDAWVKAEQAKMEEYARAREAARVRVGKMVEVFKGRKIPVGTRGEVFWMGAGIREERVGIKDAAGKVYWTAKSNVRVVMK